MMKTDIIGTVYFGKKINISVSIQIVVFAGKQKVVQNFFQNYQ